VTEQLQQLGGRLVTAPPKSEAGRRVIALDSTTVAALRVHRARQQAEQGRRQVDGDRVRVHHACGEAGGSGPADAAVPPPGR
jgi:hypothetical protein